MTKPRLRLRLQLVQKVNKLTGHTDVYVGRIRIATIVANVLGNYTLMTADGKYEVVPSHEDAVERIAQLLTQEKL